jgi:hypothetical protein
MCFKSEKMALKTLLQGYHGTALYIAAINGYFEYVQLLIDHGVDPNCRGNKCLNLCREALKPLYQVHTVPH